MALIDRDVNSWAGGKAAGTCQHHRLGTVRVCNLPGEPDRAVKRLAGEPEPLLGGGLDDVACECAPVCVQFDSGQGIFGWREQARRANFQRERSQTERVPAQHPLLRLLLRWVLRDVSECGAPRRDVVGTHKEVFGGEGFWQRTMHSPWLCCDDSAILDLSQPRMRCAFGV